MSTPNFPEMSRAELELGFSMAYSSLILAVRQLLAVEGAEATQPAIDTKVESLLQVAAGQMAERAPERCKRHWAGIVHGVLLALLVSTGIAHGQMQRTDLALTAADLTIRTLDLTSTHTLLNSPCKCWHEVDPFSPGGRSAGPLAAFQYGMSATVTVGSRELALHHHPRLGRLLVIADIVSESIAVERNMRVHELPHTGLVATRR